MPVNPPKSIGPPLKSLRAFEAAARYSSFVKAADELCVTPGAIAQQVKILENWAGDKLFERHARGITITSLGKSISADLSTAFDQLGKVVQKLRVRPKDIRISALPSLAQLWVMPMLPIIRKTIPEARISVTALEQPPNMLREPFDISIFFEENPDPEESIILGRDEIFPVCTKQYAQKVLHNKKPTKLELIHDSIWRDDWDIWQSNTDETDIVETTGSEFSLYSLAIEETLNGAGILIGHAILVKNLLDSGKLIVPFKSRVPLDRYITMKVSKSSENMEYTQKVISMMKAHAV